MHEEHRRGKSRFVSVYFENCYEKLYESVLEQSRVYKNIPERSISYLLIQIIIQIRNCVKLLNLAPNKISKTLSLMHIRARVSAVRRLINWFNVKNSVL